MIWAPHIRTGPPADDNDFDGTPSIGYSERIYVIQDANFNTTALYHQAYFQGDGTGDGHIDSSDLTVIANNWQAHNIAGGDEVGDFNHDGNVDQLDEDYWDAHRFTSGTAPGWTTSERLVYDSYGKFTVYNGDYSATTSNYLGVQTLFQGMWYDNATGWYMDNARIYSGSLERFGQIDPDKTINGPNMYQFVLDNPVDNTDPTGLYLVAFDGTWDEPAKRVTVIQQFWKGYGLNGKDYEKGIGNASDNGKVGGLLGGALGAGGRAIVEASYLKLADAYTKNVNPGDRDIDIVGYSRGSFQALLLAQMIAEKGVPDTSTAKTHTVKIPGNDKRAGRTSTITTYCRYFHPNIRFLGLVDPVAQFNLPNSPIDTLGWPTQAPSIVQNFTYLLATANDSQILRHMEIPGSGATKITRIPIATPGATGADAHGAIGGSEVALEALVNAARAAGVPVNTVPFNK